MILKEDGGGSTGASGNFSRARPTCRVSHQYDDPVPLKSLGSVWRLEQGKGGFDDEGLRHPLAFSALADDALRVCLHCVTLWSATYIIEP